MLLTPEASLQPLDIYLQEVFGGELGEVLNTVKIHCKEFAKN